MGRYGKHYGRQYAGEQGISKTKWNIRTLNKPMRKDVQRSWPQSDHTSHWSRITGFCPVYGNISKSSRKRLRITGILAKLSQKCSKLGLFVEFYNFSLENVPNFTFFPVKIPYFTIFWGVFVKFYFFFPKNFKILLILLVFL